MVSPIYYNIITLGGRGSAETPKLYYVIYEQSLIMNEISPTRFTVGRATYNGNFSISLSIFQLYFMSFNVQFDCCKIAFFYRWPLERWKFDLKVTKAG